MSCEFCGPPGKLPFLLHGCKIIRTAKLQKKTSVHITLLEAAAKVTSAISKRRYELLAVETLCKSTSSFVLPFKIFVSPQNAFVTANTSLI